jgi:single-strand DNA-binding protein
MLNLTLVGNLGSDATVGATHKGTPIATLRVAVNQSRTETTTGERIESAEWFRVRAMGRLVDLAQRLTKGTRVLVIGRLDIGHYQSSEGDARVSYDLWADELVSLGPRPDGDRGGSGGHKPDQHRPSQPPAPPPGTGSQQQPADRSQPSGPSRVRTNPDDQDDQDLPW